MPSLDAHGRCSQRRPGVCQVPASRRGSSCCGPCTGARPCTRQRQANGFQRPRQLAQIKWGLELQLKPSSALMKRPSALGHGAAICEYRSGVRSTLVTGKGGAAITRLVALNLIRLVDGPNSSIQSIVVRARVGVRCNHFHLRPMLVPIAIGLAQVYS